MTKQYRAGLPAMPERIKRLPVDARGYPIPWFVATLDDGTRDFRVADGRKRVLAVKKSLCWICGDKLGQHKAFVIGPMCAVNRNTSEPPCHRECAEFAAMACPFLALPKAQQRKANMPEGLGTVPHGLAGNPGACCIWITPTFRPYKVEGGTFLIRLGEPTATLWYAEGKPATRAQIVASFDERLPLLQKVAAEEGPEAVAMLYKLTQHALRFLPAA